MLEHVDVVLLEERRRPAAPGAGQAGDRGRQAAVHRQADGRLAGRRASRSSAWPRRQTCPASPVRRCGSAPAFRRPATASRVRRGQELHGLEPDEHRAAPPRPVLVRHPRLRDPVHDHGPGLQDGHPRGTRTRSSASGRTAARGRSSARRATAPRSWAAKGSGAAGKYEGYKPLVVEICKFFKTGKPPVAEEETLEIYTFMEAADESKRQGGATGDHGRACSRRPARPTPPRDSSELSGRKNETSRCAACDSHPHRGAVHHRQSLAPCHASISRRSSVLPLSSDLPVARCRRRPSRRCR